MAKAEQKKEETIAKKSESTSVPIRREDFW